MRPHDVEALLDIDVLVGGAHAVRDGASDAGRDVAVAPEARAGAAEADDRLGVEAA